MNIQEIKQLAASHPEQLEINWDKLDSDISYRVDFEQIVLSTLSTVPTLELIHEKLSTGKSVIVPELDTRLSAGEVDTYLDAVEEELRKAYQLQTLWDTYQKVNSIVINT